MDEAPKLLVGAVSISERRLLRETLDDAECFLVIRRIIGERWARMFETLCFEEWPLLWSDWQVPGDEAIETGLQVRVSDAASE